MKSEQIKAEIAELESIRAKITRQIAEKNDAYLQALNDESKFQEGEPVILFRKQYNGEEKKVGIGIYGSVFMNNGRPKHWIWKVKQDGTASKNNWSVLDYDRFEKFEQ